MSMKFIVSIAMLTLSLVAGFQTTAPACFVSNAYCILSLERTSNRFNVGNSVKRTFGSKIRTPKMQFGAPDEDTPKITRDAEPENFFQTNLDKASAQEKMKDPLLLIVAAWIGFMAVASTVIILNGVN
mmetsp:Transcript_15557/g.23173  ORF Transcript_15557/g.23173 Transcript_15557/m.23173 type:complete len:128 (-) Transcript_15557:40-423(-)